MFHRGEQQAQEKAGYQRVKAAIYPTMPEQHRLFYQGLQTFYLTFAGADGYPVAALIQGAQGFIATPDEQHLDISRSALHNLPYLPAIQPGMPFGGLGIDLSNRRRNRVNGVVERIDQHSMRIRVQESFGNCPQYIQRRVLPPPDSRRQPGVEPLAALDADARYLIAAADTFFVASHARRAGGVGGADISHRGGVPGFITLSGGKLLIPDYSGNRYMNTLGNILLEPRVALLVMDFQQGAALHIQGRAGGSVVAAAGRGAGRTLLDAGTAAHPAPASAAARGRVKRGVCGFFACSGRRAIKKGDIAAAPIITASAVRLSLSEEPTVHPASYDSAAEQPESSVRQSRRW